VPATALRRPAAVLPILAAVWLTGAEGVTVARWAGFATAILAASAAGWTLLGRRQRRPGLDWLLALVAWAAFAAAVRPVARAEAAWLVAVGGVALLLGVVVATPAGAVWSRLTVLGLAAASATWMLVERLLAPGRPGGPVDDPNRAATVIALGLALLPELRAPAWARAVLAALLASGVAVSGSRAALVAVLAALAWRAVAASSVQLRRFALAVALAAAAALALRVALDRDPLRFERLRIWGVAARTAAAAFPLGTGPGGYRDAAVGHNFPRAGEFARYHRVPSLAENDALQLLATLGAPGCVAAAGLLAVAVRRGRRRRELGGVLAVLLVTSAFHSQLWVPLVAWASVLAMGAAWGREPASRWRPERAAVAAAVPLVAAVLAAALAWPRGGLLADDWTRARRAGPALSARSPDPVELAGAEADAWLAATAAPAHPEAWRRVGDLRLQRAVSSADALLAERAWEAYDRARELNPLDVWALFGRGRAAAAIGRGEEARASLRAAVTVEPNCVPAWLELSRVELELGEVAAAWGSLRRAEAALDEARGASAVSAYERALAAPDPVLLARLRAALGEPR